MLYLRIHRLGKLYKLTNIMNLKRITLAFLALGVLLTACREEEDFGIPKITLDNYEAALDKADGSATVTINATRDWYIANAEKLADWIAVTPAEGKASNQPQTVKVTVNANPGYDRTADVVFSIGLAKATLAVNQKGEKGELSLGSGTKDDPFTVAGVIAYTQSLGADVESPSPVFFKGTVSDVATTFAGSGTYGNATFYIVDPEGSDRFYCYQTYYLGNRKWKSGDTEVQKDDEVIMCGKVVNYKGNTPETVGKGGSFIYSLNGKSEGGGDVPTPGSAKGSGTLADPYNPAGAAAYAQSLGSDVQSPGSVYIKGKITSVETTFAGSGTYGNATFTIADADDGSGSFYIYQTYYLGNRKWKSGDKEVKEGDEVIICGPVVNYKGNTPETAGKGASYIYSLNGETGDTPGPGPGPGSAKGSGTLEDPYNPAGAAAYAQSLGSDVQSPGSVYIKGKISDVSTTFAGSGTYGNATFTIVDADDGSGSFYIYQTYYLGNRKWESGDKEVKEGDIVIVYGPVVNYKGNTPETAGKGASYIYSLNGETGGDTPGPGPGPDPGVPSGDGTLASPYNPAGVVQYIDGQSYDENADVYVKGKISSIRNAYDASYGTAIFTISEDGTTSGTQFTCYSLYFLENKSWVDGNQQIKVGDEVVVCGKVMLYGGSVYETQSKKAYLYSLNGETKATTDGPGPGPGPGDGDFTSNVTWELGANAYDNVDAVVNGVSDVKVLKLGKGTDWGKATITLPSGSTKLTLYAVSWNNADVADLVFTVNGTDVATISPKANSGLKGNSTYQLTVTDSDKFTVNLGGAATTVDVRTSGGYRAAMFGIKAE